MIRARLTATDRDRIGQVFEDHRSFVEAVAVQHAGRDDAGDVVAEVGLRLCTSLNGLRDPDAVRAWIYRATVNAARDLFAERQRLQRTRDSLAAVSRGEDVGGPDPYDALRATRRREALMAALDRLKSRDKSTLCDNGGLGGVFTTYRHRSAPDRRDAHRARRRLRDVLQLDPRFDE